MLITLVKIKIGPTEGSPCILIPYSLIICIRVTHNHPHLPPNSGLFSLFSKRDCDLLVSYKLTYVMNSIT